MQIFEHYCGEREHRVRWRGASKTCSTTITSPRGIALRGCHPRDLIDQSLSLADYLGQPRG